VQPRFDDDDDTTPRTSGGSTEEEEEGAVVYDELTAQRIEQVKQNNSHKNTITRQIKTIGKTKQLTKRNKNLARSKRSFSICNTSLRGQI
jgi:hypothetical protein